MLDFVNILLFITAFRKLSTLINCFWMVSMPYFVRQHISTSLLVNIARSLCCLHRAKALVPYDEHGRRCSGEKMWLNLQVIIAILEAKARECQGWWESETRKWARPQRHSCLHHNCASHWKVGCLYFSFLFTTESVTYLPSPLHNDPAVN